MRDVGFAIEGGDSERRFAAAFALAEHLTGVRITPETLRASPFQCGLAPLP
jgi:hypothetical protein